MEYKFNKIEDAIDDIRNGKMVVVVDDENRENEGDLVMAAEKVTPEAVNFMIKHAGGLVCMPITQQRMNELQIDMMVKNNTDKKCTAFTVSLDAADCNTGISAFERAHTISKIANPKSLPEDFTSPGHVFPLIANDKGVLGREGHTEAAVDFAQLAGLTPAGVICEIVNENGKMARVPDLMKYVKNHNLKITTIADLIKYRKKNIRKTERVVETILPTKYGTFKVVGYIDKTNGEHHIALVKGNVSVPDSVLCRIHSECLTGDVFGSLRCDCGDQLALAMKTIEEKGCGIVLYMRQEGRGIGLINKLKAYKLQEQGLDTVDANIKLGFEADLRKYDICAEILSDLGIKKVVLMTNNPLKIEGLKSNGIEVVERQKIQTEYNINSKQYMETKINRMGHLLNLKHTI